MPDRSKAMFDCTSLTPVLPLSHDLALQVLSRGDYTNQLCQSDEDNQLHKDALAMDQEIQSLKKQMFQKIRSATDSVIENIERTNLNLKSSALANGGGQLLSIYGGNLDNTDVTVQDVLGVAQGVIRRAGFIQGRVFRYEFNVERDCGIADYKKTLSEYGIFFNMESLFNNIGHYDSVAFHPAWLRYQSCIFGETLKERLSCIIKSGNGASASLVRCIDQMVLAINTRLSITQKLMHYN